MPPVLSIVIVSYNASTDLQRCLESLTAGPPACAHEIAVIDNASEDGSADVVRARWPEIQVLVQAANVGVAAANNIGIRATRGELVLLLNSDTIVPPGAIDGLIDRLRATPDAAAAGPRLVDASGRVELSFGPMISPFGELRQKVIMRLHERGFAPADWWVRRRTGRERFVDWVSGAALLVHRRDAEAAGLLDERFFLYTEDVDFCASLRARGRRILFTPAVTIVHLRGRSRASAAVRSHAAYRRSHMAFYEKHHPGWAPLLRAYVRIREPRAGGEP